MLSRSFDSPHLLPSAFLFFCVSALFLIPDREEKQNESHHFTFIPFSTLPSIQTKFVQNPQPIKSNQTTHHHKCTNRCHRHPRQMEKPQNTDKTIMINSNSISDAPPTDEYHVTMIFRTNKSSSSSSGWTTISSHGSLHRKPFFFSFYFSFFLEPLIRSCIHCTQHQHLDSKQPSHHPFFPCSHLFLSNPHHHHHHHIIVRSSSSSPHDGQC